MKQVPTSEQGERGVLGSILMNPEKIGSIDLDQSDFYDRKHQLIWQTLSDMYTEGEPMDPASVEEYFNNKNVTDAIGGIGYLIDLQDETLIPAYSQHYSDMVKRASNLRCEIKTLEDGLGLAYAGESASEGVISSLIGQLSVTNKEVGMDELAESFIDNCDRGEVGHFGWWCDEWTNYLGKMSSDLMIFHAPRSTGKTAMMLQWIVNAHKSKQRTPLASIEMLKKELAPRFIAHMGQVSTYRMRTRGHITPDERDRSRGTLQEIKALELCIRDKAMTIDDIRAWAISEHRDGADAIFIDNLLSISDGGKQYQSKTIMYDDFIRKLRDLRDLLAIPIIILAHPNSEGQVAWSRDVENFADIILFMHNVPPEGIKENGVHVTKDLSVEGQHILAMFQKNRQGISPMASLDFNGDTQTFKHMRWEY